MLKRLVMAVAVVSGLATGVALASNIYSGLSPAGIAKALACPGTSASTATVQVCTQAGIASCPSAGTPLSIVWTPYIGSGATTSLAAGGCTLPVTTNEGSTVTSTGGVGLFTAAVPVALNLNAGATAWVAPALVATATGAQATGSVTIGSTVLPATGFSVTVGPTTWTSAALYSFSYTSGATASCTAGQYLLFTFSDGATGHVACAAGGNAITGGTAGSSIVAGSGLTAPPTTATCGTGTAGTTCSGTIVLTSAIAISPTAAGWHYLNLTGPTTVLLPTITSTLVSQGFWEGFRNYTGILSAITLRAPASTYIDVMGAVASSGGYMLSSGALGDEAYVSAATTTLYMGSANTLNWSNH